MLLTFFYFGLASPGGPRGGSGLSPPSGNRGCWADSDADPVGKIFSILILALSAVGLCQQAMRPKLSGSHNRILDLSFDGGPEHVTKWHHKWLILGACGTIFRTGPAWRGPRAKFGRKTTENQPKL